MNRQRVARLIARLALGIAVGAALASVALRYLKIRHFTGLPDPPYSSARAATSSGQKSGMLGTARPHIRWETTEND